MGRVSNLRVVESLGSTVRLGWTGVTGATQYRIIIRNAEGTQTDFAHSVIICFDYGQIHTCLYDMSVRASSHDRGRRGNP